MEYHQPTIADYAYHSAEENARTAEQLARRVEELEQLVISLDLALARHVQEHG